MAAEPEQLTLNSYIVAPAEGDPTSKLWAGTLDEAMRLDGDSMWRSLIEMCHEAGVRVEAGTDEDDADPRPDDELLADLIAAGVPVRHILRTMFSDPGARIVPPEKRLRFRWQEGAYREDLLLPGGGVALGQGEENWYYQVFFEILDPEDGKWVEPQADWPELENYRPWGDLVEGFVPDEDNDPETPWPYVEAEERLLQKAGLRRRDITDPAEVPW